MKTINKNLKITILILLIVLISLISFVGIFIQNKNNMNNIIKDYTLGMNLVGSRRIQLDVNKSNKTTNYDTDGKEIESTDTTTEVASTKEEPINSQDVLNKDNYIKSKQVIEKRLEILKVPDYTIRQNEEDGTILLQLPENTNTDKIVSQLQYQGLFEIVDADTKEVLMDNSDLESVQAGYGSTSSTSNTTTVFLSIQFNKEGTNKFKDITNKYVETKTIQEGSTEETTSIKKIKIQIDGQELLSTYFQKEISNGLLQLSVGSSTTSTTNEELQEYMAQASNMSSLLNSGKMPVKYTNAQNKFVKSDITSQLLAIAICVGIAILALGMVYLIIKYKKTGILSSISLIGFVALLLVTLRYANVTITIEGISAIALAVIVNYLFVLNIIKDMKEKEENKITETIKKFIKIIIPIYIIAITFTFSSWLPIYSFGMIMFWGLTISMLYNLIITKQLLD